MSDPVPLPEGFAVGHWSDPVGGTGCTVVIPPAETRGGVCVHGGGPGTRETDTLRPLANATEATAVLITGGSAFGLAAADGVVRWLEEHDRGYFTPFGRVPIVPAAVIYDLPSGDGSVRPGPDAGLRGLRGSGRGDPGARRGRRRDRGHGGQAARARAVPAGRDGLRGARHRDGPHGRGRGGGERGRRRDRRGRLGAGRPAGEEEEPVRGAELIAAMEQPPEFRVPEGNSTPVVICTDAALDKRQCSIVARAATAGMGRAIDPVFTPVDGDVVFCLASGRGRAGPVRAAPDRRGGGHRHGRGDPGRGPPGLIRPGAAAALVGHARELQDRGRRPAEHPLRRG